MISSLRVASTSRQPVFETCFLQHSLSCRPTLSSVDSLRQTRPTTAKYRARYHINSNALDFPREDLNAIREILHSTPAIEQTRIETLRRVKTTIQKEYGDQYPVELYGSIRYGVSQQDSDLDMVILDPTRPYGTRASTSESENLPVIYDVRQLARVIRKGFIKVVARPNGSVPIVRFQDPQTRLHCDVNVNDRFGIANSNLIKKYCDYFPPLRQMLIIIKLWARPLGLNDPSPLGRTPTFSSYALALMTIGFLQHRGLLPKLQECLPPVPSESTPGPTTLWDRRTSKEWDVRYHRQVPWVPPKVPLAQVIRDWFDYWGTEHVYSLDHALCIRQGGVIVGNNGTPHSGGNVKLASVELLVTDVGRETNANRRPGYSIRVLDPFIQTKNVTGVITSASLMKFERDCKRASDALRRFNSITALSLLIPSLRRDRRNVQQRDWAPT